MDIQSSLHLLESLNYELAHDDMREPYIRVTVDEKKMLFKLRSSEFKRFFSYRYMQANNTSPAGKLINTSIEYLEGKAIFESEMIEPDVRLIGDADQIEIDLCDNSYQVVKITREGFELGQPEGFFLRRHGLLALPEPIALTDEQCHEAIADFKSILNVSDEQFVLVIGAVLMGFHSDGPYPVLFVQGEHGSAKGSLCEAIKSVLDPNKTAHTALPSNAGDLLIQATSNRVLSFDNLSEYTFTKKHSDLFAQMATGVGLRKRQLYTDDGECVICVSRMTLMNGIDDVVTQSDLGSRTIGLRLTPVDKQSRISKREFNDRLEQVRPNFFSAVVKVISCILRNFDETHIESSARMFDMIQWVTAGESQLGWEAGTFQRIYEQNQIEVMEIGLGEDPLATALIRFMNNNPSWRGDASRLLSCLNASAERGFRNSKTWPRSPISLGRGLTRIETSLRLMGITMTRNGRSASERTIELVNTRLVETEPLSEEQEPLPT